MITSKVTVFTDKKIIINKIFQEILKERKYILEASKTIEQMK